MKGKTCLVTGGTSGVGRAIAQGLADMGARVIITSRDREKGENAALLMREASGNEEVSSLVVDLSAQSSIRNFARDFLQKYQGLHVLDNNAAVFPMRREETEDGIESVLGTNYLGHFLLTYLLIDVLKQSRPSRIITVSGNPAILRLGKIHFDDIQLRKSFNPFRATLQAAYAKVIFSMELAKSLENTGVTVHTFHPGLVKSNLAGNFPGILQPAVFLLEAFLSSSCKPGIFAASSGELETITGKFIRGEKAFDFRSPGYTRDTGSRLWKISCELTGIDVWI